MKGQAVCMVKEELRLSQNSRVVERVKTRFMQARSPACCDARRFTVKIKQS